MLKDEYEKVGRVLKHLHPGRFEGNTDEEVGLVHVESVQFSEQRFKEAKHVASNRVSEILGGGSKPGLFEGIFQVGGEQRRAEILEYRTKQAHSITAIQTAELESLKLEFERERLPEILAAAEFIRELQMQLQVDIIDDQQRAIKAHQELREIALKDQLTLEGKQSQLQTTFNNNEELRKEREQSRIKLNERAEEKRIDFGDYEQREVLKQTLEVKTYREKSEALTQHALFEDTVRKKRADSLDDLYIEFHKLNKLVVFPEDEPLKMKRLASKQKEIDRLEAILHGVGRDSKGSGTEGSGEDDGGGTPPTESGFPPKAEGKHSKQPPPSSNLGHVN